MSVETTTSKSSIFSKILYRYEQARGWWPGGTEWLKRRDTVYVVAQEALRMERKGHASDEIFENIKSAFDARGIKWSMGTDPVHPLANREEHKFPRSITANYAGDNKKHHAASGLHVYSEGDAYALDNHLFKPNDS